MTEFQASRPVRRLAWAVLAGIATILLAPAAHSAERLNAVAWKPGAQWMSLRFGYAKEQGNFSPNGNVGYGMGYSRMVSKRLSLGANIQHDLLGKYGGAALIAVPLTVEALWHFNWGNAAHPYVGAGMAGVLEKAYRTGADATSVQPGYSLTVGANLPTDAGHLLGLDFRFASVANEGWSVDPVFLTRRPKQTLLSLKLNYALTY